MLLSLTLGRGRNSIGLKLWIESEIDEVKCVAIEEAMEFERNCEK